MLSKILDYKTPIEKLNTFFQIFQGIGELPLKFFGCLLIVSKICALISYIWYYLCTKGHSNHPTWPKSMLKP